MKVEESVHTKLWANGKDPERMLSGTRGDELNQLMPQTDSTKSVHVRLRVDKGNPKRKKSRVETAGFSQEDDLAESESPRCAK